MRRAAALLVAIAAALNAAPAAAAPPHWQPVARIGGIFDVGGPQNDGRLVVAGAGQLYLVDPQGVATPFAQGPGGYADDKGGEAYLTLSHGLHPGGPGCDFQPGDVYILRLHAPLGITKIDVNGQKTAFATIPGVQSLNGIAFDTVGFFGHRLLATGAAGGGKTEVAAVDCNGGVQVLTRNAPTLEGGLDVAPIGFGAFAGKLIAPDEYSGNLYAIGADGSSSLVARSGLPTGGDIGVESVGFVPPGFMAGGSVFYADRATPGNPHPGTDSLLRLTSSDLAGGGVQDGDLLAATEGGATLIDVRCGTACTVTKVIENATTAHGEGHLAFIVTIQKVDSSPSALPTPSPTPAPKPAPHSPAATVALIVTLAVLGAGALAVLRARWGSPGSGSAPPSP
jgi:hypothetical protein